MQQNNNTELLYVALLLAALTLIPDLLAYGVGWLATLFLDIEPTGYSLLAGWQILLQSDGAMLKFGVNAPLWLFIALACLVILPVIAGIIYALILVARRKRRIQTDAKLRPGMATKEEIRRHYSAKTLTKRAGTLRPSLKDIKPRKIDPKEVGYLVGTAQGIEIYEPVENAGILIGPARQGKSVGLVQPMIIDAPGAVLSTSLRMENATTTYKYRQHKGPVTLFDPLGVDNTGLFAEGMRWGLTNGCEDPYTAASRAAALCANAGAGVENASFWQSMAQAIVQPLLHAAALDGGGTDKMFEWCQSPKQAASAVDVLASNPRAAQGWALALSESLSTDERTLSNIWAQITSTIVQPLMIPSIRKAVTERSGNNFNIETFIKESGTLYAVAGDNPISSSINAALIEDIYEQAQRLAATMPGNRLDPPLLFSLDEVANIAKLPSLPQMVSAGGGSGITTWAVIQSLAQIRDKWGVENAASVWESATTRIVLGGLTSDKDLDAISAIAGEIPELQTSKSRSQQGISHSDSYQYRRILSPAQIRGMEVGTALLISGSKPIVLLDTIPLYERKITEPRTTESAKSGGQDGIGERSHRLGM